MLQRRLQRITKLTIDEKYVAKNIGMCLNGQRLGFRAEYAAIHRNRNRPLHVDDEADSRVLNHRRQLRRLLQNKESSAENKEK